MNRSIKINPENSIFQIATYLLLFSAISPLTEKLFNFPILARFSIWPALILYLIIDIRFFLKQTHVSDRVFNSYFYLFSIYSVILLVRGVYYKYPLDFILQDFSASVFILTGLCYGYKIDNWKIINKTFIIILFIGLIVNIIALSYINIFDRANTYSSLAYDVQYILWPSLFFLLIIPLQKNVYFKYIIYFSFIIYIIEQYLFQKRLPIIIGLICFLIFIYLRIKKTQSIKNKSKFYLNLLIVFISIFGSLLILISATDFLGSSVTTSFLDRFKDNETENGMTLENSRFISATVIFNSISGNEIIWGQGFGAYSTSKELFWNMDTENNQKGVNIIEVGQIWPYWKGGIIYFILLNAFTFLALKKSKFHGILHRATYFFAILLFFAHFSQSYVGSERLFTLLWALTLGVTISFNQKKPKLLK